MRDAPPSQFLDALVRADFPSFVARAIAELEPGTHYTENWHLLHLTWQLERVRAGEIRRLMINQPPRSLKTHVASICYPAWVLGHDPTRRILCITYSQEIARAQAVLFRKLVTSDWYRRTFSRTEPAALSRLLDWQTSAGGCRLATSIEGSILGRGADFIILDDPNKGQEIYSKLARDKVKTSYDHTIATRLIHPKEGAIICCMQRLHADDLAGHMLEQEEWEQVVIPAMAVEDEQWDLGGGMVHTRLAGELLQPDRMGHAELALKRRQMGMIAFEAQYQQRPIPPDGVVVKRQWLLYYDGEPEAFEFKLASWDTASTLSEDADWSVGTVWGIIAGRIYLLHVERAKLEAPDLRHRIEAIHRRFAVDVTLIEDADLGRGIVQDLRRTSSVCVPIAIKPHIDKLARMQARAVMFETGRVFLPRAAEWLAAYLEELLGFPNAKKDDQVDSTSQALDFLQQRFAGDMRDRPRTRPSGAKRPQGLPLRGRR